MTHTYNITGLTCNGCVAKAKSALLKIGDITTADVQLNAPQATITMQQHIPLSTLQTALHKAGNYSISAAQNPSTEMESDVTKSWLSTYKPIVLIFAYILGTTLLIQFSHGHFNIMQWMQHFMAGFFLTFSFFKLLNVKGFAESYAMYDIVAKHWNGWGYVYPFIELGLGILYLVAPTLLLTHIFTLVVMGVSIVGVLASVMNKRKIQCACLGDIFKLPMSTITIIEDGLMIAMAGIMIATMI